jgi:hypothetical protein
VGREKQLRLILELGVSIHGINPPPGRCGEVFSLCRVDNRRCGKEPQQEDTKGTSAKTQV